MNATRDLNAAAERVRMCLAEAGYTDPTCVFIGRHTYRAERAVHILSSIPRQAAFQAFLVSGLLKRCRACWWNRRACLPDDHDDDCTMDGWS